MRTVYVSLVALAVGVLLALAVSAAGVPHCPAEDSCWLDYREGRWHVEPGDPPAGPVDRAAQRCQHATGALARDAALVRSELDRAQEQLLARVLVERAMAVREHCTR